MVCEEYEAFSTENLMFNSKIIGFTGVWNNPEKTKQKVEKLRGSDQLSEK